MSRPSLQTSYSCFFSNHENFSHLDYSEQNLNLMLDTRSNTLDFVLAMRVELLSDCHDNQDRFSILIFAIVGDALADNFASSNRIDWVLDYAA